MCELTSAAWQTPVGRVIIDVGFVLAVVFGIGMRHRTDEDRPTLPRAPAGDGRATVWQRDGRAEYVLAEPFALP